MHEADYTRENRHDCKGGAPMMKEQIEKLSWWHVITFPDGTVTPGRCDYRQEEHSKRFQLPEDMTGLNVLDLGTFDGYWAIEAKKRGADVVAADRWEPMLETAKLALGSFGIPYCWLGDLDKTSNANWMHGMFDIVLFYGILYHLKNPYEGMLNAARFLKPGGRLFLESAVNQGKMAGLSSDIPLLWVIDEVHHGDATNYHMPNEAAIIQLAKMAGLERYGEIIYGEGGFRVGMTFKKQGGMT
jgi:2-polyprenyl-3-methyl-5-hydroxy-6-metoxy-1,4-benzoquinol methylase